MIEHAVITICGRSTCRYQTNIVDSPTTVMEMLQNIRHHFNSKSKSSRTSKSEFVEAILEKVS